MLELSPYLIVTIFNLIKKKRGITEKEITEALRNQTGLESIRLTEAIQKSITFLLESKLIAKFPGEQIRYKKVDKAELSISDSIALANNLGIKCEKITIKPIYNQFIESLKKQFKGTEFTHFS